MHLHLRPLLFRAAALAVTLSLSAAERPAVAGDPPRDSIAVAVVFDTSGSMRAAIATKKGSPPDAKLRIAQRAFGKVLDRLDAFSRQPGAKPVAIGIYTFSGQHAVAARPLGAFHLSDLRLWLQAVRADGPTPLGAALFAAGRDLLAYPASSRHLLVLTDGANTVGPSPEQVLAQISAACQRKQVAVFTHVIALDIKPETFAALQKQGATLIGAMDETQLNAQFDFILEEKILVEAPR